MTRTSFHNKCVFFTITLVFQLSAATAMAQTPGFTYQGRLTDGGTAANGNYDLQFVLWDSLAGGAQIGAPQTVSNVPVSAGIFTVQLDFGANAFPGANRFLEISARLSGGGSFTTLSPRQPITSTPYAIRSLNASSADTVTVNGVPGGSGSYIQNTTTPQASANFNISGNGTAGGTLSGNIINAATQYNLGGSRILSKPGTRNLFAGENAGTNETNGGFNSYFGWGAGRENTNGCCNSFFGDEAGVQNKGTHNNFFGSNAGSGNTFGYYNVFFGVSAGDRNTIGSQNTVIGHLSNVGSPDLTNATAIGAFAQVDQSNSLVLGSIAGINSASTSVNVGIGTTTPQARLDVNGTALFRGGATVTGTNGDGAVLTARRPTGDPFVIIDATTVAQNSVLAFRKNNFNRWLMYADSSTESGGNAGSDFKLDAYNNAGGIANYLFVTRANGNVGIGMTTPSEKLSVSGKLRLDQIDSGLGAGTVQLCRNAANVIATCSSSLRYKNNIATFHGGLDIVSRLRPISFTWKQDGTKDIGFGAEEVEKVAPLFTFRNDKGEIEGVRYDRLNVVFVNAIKEQQAQIEKQQQQLREQQQQMATLQQMNSALNARLHKIERVLRKRSPAARRR